MFILSNKLESYIEKAIKIFVPLVFFIPLILNSNFYFPFVTPRTFLFRLIVTVILGLYLILFVLNKKKYNQFNNKILISYLALAFLLTVSSFLAGDFLYSFWGNAERMEGLLGLYYLIAFFIVLAGVYYRKKSWLFLLYVTSFVSFIVGFIGLSQAMGLDLLLASSGGARVSATLGNPTYLATYALFHLFFSAYLFFKDNNRRLRFELIAFYIIDIILIVLEVMSRQKGGVGILTIIFTNFSLIILFLIPQILININFFLYNKRENISKICRQIYFIFLALLNFIALFNTQTRGVLVGIFVSFLAMAIFLLFSKYVNKKLKYFTAAALVLFIILVSFIFVFKQSNFIQNNNTLKRAANISLTDTTTKTRLLTWQISIDGFKDKPIFGWGEEKFYVVFNKYFPVDIFEDLGSQVWFDRPHNVFIQQLIHGGILGFLAYLSIFFFAFRNLFGHYRKTKDVKTIIIFGGLIIAYLVQNFFVFDSISTYIPMILILVITSFLVSSKKNIIQIQPLKLNDNKLWLISLLLFVTFGLGYYFNIPAAKANVFFVDKFISLRDQNASRPFNLEMNKDLLDGINSGYLGKFEFRQVYSEYAYSLIQRTEVPLYTKGRTMELAEEELVKSIKEQPDNVRHHSFLANLYLAGAFLDPMYAQRNVDLIEKQAINLSPTRTQLYYTLGSAYMTLDNYEKSVENFTKAKNLSPKVFESHQNLFSAYLSGGDTDKAKETLVDMSNNVKLSIANYSHIAKIFYYFSLKQEAADYLEEAILVYPDNSDLLVQLSAYYDDIGDKGKLNQTLDKLEKVNPSFTKEIRDDLNL